jgi:dCTP diphosphatase
MGEDTHRWKATSLQDLRRSLQVFCTERDWEQFHTPRNLLLALVGEIGELSELFQWRGEVESMLTDWNDADKKHLGEELADCLLYLVRLSDRCGVDLAEAALKKIEKNRVKYPAEKARGKADKYTAYVEEKEEKKDEEGGEEF